MSTPNPPFGFALLSCPGSELLHFAQQSEVDQGKERETRHKKCEHVVIGESSAKNDFFEAISMT